MLRAVVKWSYIKGRSGLARAKSHINYIQYREGADRARGPRYFFDSLSNSIPGAVIKARLAELNQRDVQIHKIILSPGLNNADMFAYAREMMSNLSSSKGLDLEWYAVTHENTEHLHSHVVVLGTDLQGRAVHLNGKDSKQLRKWGNEFLDREHNLERYLDQELKRLLGEPTRAAKLEFQRQRGDQEFERLMFGGTTKHHGDWKTFEQELQSFLGPEQNDGRRKSYKQYQTESAGRLLDFHERYQENAMRTYWDDIAKAFPEMASDAQRELTWLNELKQEGSQIIDELDIDQLLTGLSAVERYLHTFVSNDIKQLEREGVFLSKDYDHMERTLGPPDKLKQLTDQNVLDHAPKEQNSIKADERERGIKQNRETRDR